MTTHELAKLLLEYEDREVEVSVDMSVEGDESTYSNRCFGSDFCGLNPAPDTETTMLLFGMGTLNFKPQR